MYSFLEGINAPLTSLLDDLSFDGQNSGLGVCSIPHDGYCFGEWSDAHGVIMYFDFSKSARSDGSFVTLRSGATA